MGRGGRWEEEEMYYRRTFNAMIRVFLRIVNASVEIFVRSVETNNGDLFF